MITEFSTYELYHDKASARELIRLLKKNNIEFQFEDDSVLFDPTFTTSEMNKDYRIKLKPIDFQKVDDLLNKMYNHRHSHVNENYYLYGFSDNELMEVLKKREEWNSFDFTLAQKILKSRGKEVTPEEIGSFYSQRLQELAKPTTQPFFWIFAGYCMALAGGIIGVFMGWHFYSHKKTLPNGLQVYAYPESDRKHGKRIFVLGLIIMTIGILMRIWNQYVNILQYW